MTQDRTWELG